MIALFNQERAVDMYVEAMKEESRNEGRNESRNEISQLMAKLFSLGKVMDLEKASTDPNYMQKLLKDYGLAEG